MKRNDLKDFLFKVDGEVQVLRLKSKNGKTVNGKNGKNGKNSGQWTVSGRQPQIKRGQPPLSEPRPSIVPSDFAACGQTSKG